MRCKITAILFFVILFSLASQASFIPNRIDELQKEINEFKNTIEIAKLEMRRLDYAVLSQEVLNLDALLEKTRALNQANNESEEAIQLLGDITYKIKDLQPLLYESLPVETRAIWLDHVTIESFFTTADIQKHLDELQSININLIFLEVYHNGAAIYPSKLVPQHHKVQFMYEGNDILEDILLEAKSRNIEVHPFVRVFGLHNGAEYFIEDKIHWLDKTKTNSFTLSNGFYWLSSIKPEAREYMIALLRELTENYDIDGLHLDYIRFDTDFGYNQYSRELYKSLFGIDPININSPVAEEAFTVFKTQFINKFVERTYTELKEIKPNLILSAAVSSPYTWVKLDHCQDWVNWAQNRIIHFLTPMSYRKTAAEYSSLIRSDLNATSGSTYLYSGLGVYLFDEIVLLEEVKAGQEATLTGQAIFSSANMKRTHYQVLQKGPWSRPATPTFRDPQQSAYLLLEDLHDRISEFSEIIDIDMNVSKEYLTLIKTLATTIYNCELRPWDLRDLRSHSDKEATALEAILKNIKALKDQVNKGHKESNISTHTANRIVRDLETVEGLLKPLYFTSKPYEFVPTTIL